MPAGRPGSARRARQPRRRHLNAERIRQNLELGHGRRHPQYGHRARSVARAPLPHPVRRRHPAAAAAVDPADHRVPGHVRAGDGGRRGRGDQPLRGRQPGQPGRGGDRAWRGGDGHDLRVGPAVGAAHQPRGDRRVHRPRGVPHPMGGAVLGGPVRRGGLRGAVLAADVRGCGRGRELPDLHPLAGSGSRW
jgi:hypothetical protein